MNAMKSFGRTTNKSDALDPGKPNEKRLLQIM